MRLAESMIVDESNENGSAYSNVTADESHICPCVGDTNDILLAQYVFGDTAEIRNALMSAKEANAGLRRPIPPVTRDQLNEEQLLAHDAFVD